MWCTVTRSLPRSTAGLLVDPISMVLSWSVNSFHDTVTRSVPLSWKATDLMARLSVTTAFAETPIRIDTNASNNRLVTGDTVTITGNSLDNEIWGNAGDNVIRGAGGAEQVAVE